MELVTKKLLEEALSNIAESFQLSQRHKQFFIEGLVEPSLRGIDSHGVKLAKTYFNELQSGRAKANPKITFDSTMPAAITMDAGGALGVVAGYEASEVAAARAREIGVCALLVKNSNHFGAASNYSLSLAKQGMIGIVVSNSDSLVAPVNSKKKIFGTNPISFAAPGVENEIYCLDMATSQVSLSKMIHYRKQGWPLAENWIVQGSDVNDKVATLLPLGGVKGQGLAMMVSILTGVLSNSPLDHQLSHLYEAPYDTPRQVSHFIIAINIEAFNQLNIFSNTLSEFMATIRSTASNNSEPVIVAGDLEIQSVKNREESGIPVEAQDKDFFDSWCTKL